MTPAPRLLQAGLGALLLCALVACRGGPYDAYRTEHPGWQPALPEAPAGLEELVAALHAPDAVPGIRVELSGLEILDVGTAPWRTLAPGALARGAVPVGTDHAVIARRRCRAEAGLGAREVSRIDYFLLRGGQIVAYDHGEFLRRCAVRDRFRAARRASASLERALSAYIRRHYGRRPLDPAQLYRRGLAYVEAGRPGEARALLQLGERGYRAALLELRAAGRSSDALGELPRLRAALHRALGLEPHDP